MRKLFTSALALAALLAGAQMAAAQAPVIVEAGCQDGCLQKVCKPIVAPKTIIKPVYTDKCIDYCEPRCWTCSLLSGGCDSCGPNHTCGTVKTRKVMIVKLKRCEECVNKCEVDYVPACATPCKTHCAPPCAAPCATPCATPAPTTYHYGAAVILPATPAPVVNPMPLPVGK